MSKVINFPDKISENTAYIGLEGDPELVSVVYIYKSGKVRADLSNEVTSGEQMRWVCDRLEQAKRSIVP